MDFGIHEGSRNQLIQRDDCILFGKTLSNLLLSLFIAFYPAASLTSIICLDSESVSPYTGCVTECHTI
jgi:hypothetical protein